MISLDETTGKLTYDSNFIPPKFEGLGHTVDNTKYSNFRIKNVIADGRSCDIIAYYKNDKLDNVSIFLDNDYLKNNYSPPSDIDIRDYLTPFIEYSTNELKTLIKSFLNSKRTNFSWGKVEILTDPRDQMTFICIKYSRTDFV